MRTSSKYLAFLLLLGVLVSVESCTRRLPAAEPAPANVSLVPVPAAVQTGNGYFQVNRQTKIYFRGAAPEVQATSRYLAQLLKEEAALVLPVEESKSGSKGANSILLALNPALETGPEGYRLSVTANGVRCEAKTAAGVFWGVQTLRQLLYLQPVNSTAASTKTVVLPVLDLQDEPAFAWRGLLLDVSRHFMSKDFLKRYIDLLALYKLNTLHLHLSDDQGWRVEIKKYPLLTQVGSWREEADGTRHGGFYTAEDIKELVAYAQARQITLVPEIDMPGHVQAALAAYPALSCTGGPFKVDHASGVHPDILCAGNEDTYTFLAEVLAEVAALFPGEYIHVGGDEAPKQRWQACPKCQKKIKEEGLKDEEALQGYFTQRVMALLEQVNRKPIGWDEVLNGGMGKGMLIQAWHAPAVAKKAIEAGAQVIMSTRSSFYFDLNSGITNLEKVYQAPLVPGGLSAELTKKVVGAEAALWTEVVPQEKVDYMVFPRLMAFAENAWSRSSEKNYAAFHARVQNQYAILNKKGVQYGFETWPVRFLPSYKQEKGVFEVQLQPGLSQVDLRYTIDGTTPDLSSAAYSQQPIELRGSATVQVQAFRNQQKVGEVVQASFVKHQALHKQPQLTYRYSSAFAAGGALALTDGILGGTDYRNGFWQGYAKDNLETVLDLGEEKELSEVRIGFLQDVNSWIFLPQEVEIAVSRDNVKFRTVGTLKHQVPLMQGGAIRKDFTVSLPREKGRFVRVKAKNVGMCPPEHPGAGNAAYLMADEIIVQ